jgi:hypothetical protein
MFIKHWQKFSSRDVWRRAHYEPNFSWTKAEVLSKVECPFQWALPLINLLKLCKIKKKIA